MKRFRLFFTALCFLPKICFAIELVPPPLTTDE
jgi:hypothetical protein